MRENMNRRMMVLDWGIGGLPLFEGLRAALPDADLLYLSDSGSVPYGKQSPEELRARLGEITAFAAGMKITTIAAACNAMSSVLSGARSRAGGVEIISLIHTFLASPLPRGLDAGIIGGERTIQSGVYQKAFEEAGNNVRACPAQGLSALIEAGDFDGIPSFLEKIFSRLGAVDVLVLACTHYPAASSIIKTMRPGLRLIDPCGVLLDECTQELQSFGHTKGGQIYLSTGGAELSRLSAEKAFGFTGLPFRHIPKKLQQG
jgi:glutamate racemase